VLWSWSSYLIRLRLWRSSHGELDAVRGVADVEVEDGPDERQAGGLAGEAADHLGTAFDLTERPFERVGIRYETAQALPRSQ